METNQTRELREQIDAAIERIDAKQPRDPEDTDVEREDTLRCPTATG